MCGPLASPAPAASLTLFAIFLDGLPRVSGLQIDDKFDKLDLIGEGTYGMVYKATRKG